MKIFPAKHLGMCKGLRLTMHHTIHEIETANGNEVYIFRELVHNDHVQEELIRRGAKAKISKIEDIPANSKVIVGPHSAPPSVIEEISKLGKLVDVSCRDVLKVSKAAKSLSEEGYTIIFIGMRDHEEAEIVQKVVPGSFVVSNENDINKLPLYTPLGIVSQSTLTQERFFQLVNAIKTINRDIKIRMTICNETHIRQEAAIELAKKVDKMIVIGGKYSNNTNALADVCRRYVPTWQIETESELQDSWFEITDRVGFTAGASTPDSIVNNVINRIQKIDDEKVKTTSISFRLIKIANNFRIANSRLKIYAIDRFLLVVELVKHFQSDRRNPKNY